MPPSLTYSEMRKQTPLQLPSANPKTVSTYRRTTHVSERLFGLTLFMIVLPLIAILATLVRLTSPGPGLYRQSRVGWNGRIFTILKIRTMTANAETLTGPQWTRLNDPRITRLGSFLRKSHLDELPQLWNVACGDMAIVGPRPERPELVHVLAEHVPHYVNRLAVKPGITGIAQINLPTDSDLASVRRKLLLELEYVTNATIWLDVRVFAWTVLRLFGCPAKIATSALMLKREVRDFTGEASDSPLNIGEIRT